MAAARHFSINYWYSLFGGAHGNPGQPGGGDWPTIGYALQQEAAPVAASERLVCSDNRVLFNGTFCEYVGVRNRFDYWIVDQTIDTLWWPYYSGQYSPAPSWDDWIADTLGDLSRSHRLPPGVTYTGPYAADLDPPPDFAIVTCYAPRTSWWGYSISSGTAPALRCCPADKGCPAYWYYEPYVLIDGFGEGPYADQRQLAEIPGDSPNTSYDPSGLGGNVTGEPLVGGTIFGTTAGEDMDQLLPTPNGFEFGTLGPPQVTPCPVPPQYRRIGRAPAMGGLLKPPRQTFNPSAGSANFAEAYDALNDANKYLWKWDDVKHNGLQYNWGPGQSYHRVFFGDTTSAFGNSYLSVRPFWYIEPHVEPPVITHGQISARPDTSHIRHTRRRVGHTLL